MLIKEYRIPLPLSVDEYKIAQLYMIAKKSKEETKGAGSGVEILVNEPYTNGPGGSGQFTRKVYHVGSHLPGWFKSLLPKSALVVEEEAWNAYPYTKTKFSCPFVEKFSLEIETYYTADGGHQDNIFQLSESEKRNRIVDLVDVVKDQEGTVFEDPEKEDPTVFVSEKTQRGPLSHNWLEELWPLDSHGQPAQTKGPPVMCAYKLCKVEFRYWGMQTRIERFIHDVALRRTMLKAHLQAWVWQDEWHGLTMEDIRAIEIETAAILNETMRAAENGNEVDTEGKVDVEVDVRSHGEVSRVSLSDGDSQAADAAQMRATFNAIEYSEAEAPNILTKTSERVLRRSVCNEPGEETQLRSPLLSIASPTNSKCFSGSICSEEGDEFFDCYEDLDDRPCLAKWSSMELTPYDLDNEVFATENSNRTKNFATSNQPEECSSRTRASNSRPVFGNLEIDSHPPDVTCQTSLLILVFHGGSVLDTDMDVPVRRSDVTTFRGAFEAIMRTHYSNLIGHIVIKCVPCPPICSEALAILSVLSPYSFEVNPNDGICNDHLPVAAIPIMATSSPNYQSNVSQVIQTANQIYQEFLESEKGLGFSGQVCIVGDSIGSILAYDSLCLRSAANTSKIDMKSQKSDLKNEGRQLRLQSEKSGTLIFDVSDFFALGSPLGMLLAQRKMQETTVDIANRKTSQPQVNQFYNLFHPSDQITCRIEPLLSSTFSRVPPVNVSRYKTYPMGDGSCHLLIEFIQSNKNLFVESRQESNGVGIHSRAPDAQPIQIVNTLQPKWWGNCRVDYALYCPEGLLKFPAYSLPHIFHASYWESVDVIAFILRQIVRGHNFSPSLGLGIAPSNLIHFTPNQPREKWIKKRTAVKIRNGTANHRANDVLVKEGAVQHLLAKFSYGLLDMGALTGERVDVHIMKEPPNGEWIYVSTELTDKAGKINFILPQQHTMSYGMYPVRMLVRGDHTMLHMTLAVVPPDTETVVFSIDGSFAASVSVTGKDPKVKPGAVDIVRHWQELGYIILYVTGRPDLQLRRVVSWLGQHNFPHGLVSFADGFSTDPLRHKADFLKGLIQDHNIIIHRAYGSNKDISVYSSLGLKPEQIYIVGKASKKQQNLVTFLPDGYADHLSELTAHGGSRPAQGNARMVIPKTNFGLASIRTHRALSCDQSTPVSVNLLHTKEGNASVNVSCTSSFQSRN